MATNGVFLALSLAAVLSAGPARAQNCMALADYDVITRTVTDRFYDKTFRGLDWPAARPFFVVAKLDGGSIPETLKAMRDLWRSTGHESVLRYSFESATVQNLYHDVITQGVAIGVCAALAMLIASLGLFALAAFVTERRTKEIGVRKAMGADTMAVVRLLLWQFTQPVLWANIAAWPAAYLAMDWWLRGFAYRVGVPAWLFLAATAAAALIAWLTVSVQSWMAARAKPVLALRYE